MQAEKKSFVMSEELILALPERDLDEMVARYILGWSEQCWQGGNGTHYFLGPPTFIPSPEDGENADRSIPARSGAQPYGDHLRFVPRLSTDLNLIREMETEIERQNHGWIYVWDLGMLLREALGRNYNGFDIRHATPQQCCQAALMAFCTGPKTKTGFTK